MDDLFIKLPELNIQPLSPQSTITNYIYIIIVIICIGIFLYIKSQTKKAEENKIEIFETLDAKITRIGKRLNDVLISEQISSNVIQEVTVCFVRNMMPRQIPKLKKPEEKIQNENIQNEQPIIEENPISKKEKSIKSLFQTNKPTLLSELPKATINSKIEEKLQRQKERLKELQEGGILEVEKET